MFVVMIHLIASIQSAQSITFICQINVIDFLFSQLLYDAICTLVECKRGKLILHMTSCMHMYVTSLYSLYQISDLRIHTLVCFHSRRKE